MENELQPTIKNIDKETPGHACFPVMVSFQLYKGLEPPLVVGKLILVAMRLIYRKITGIS